MTIHLTLTPCGARLCGATDGAAYLLSHCQPWHLRTYRVCGICLVSRSRYTTVENVVIAPAKVKPVKQPKPRQLELAL